MEGCGRLVGFDPTGFVVFVRTKTQAIREPPPCYPSAFCYRMDARKESRMGYKQNMRNPTKTGRRGRRPLRNRIYF